MGFDANLFLSRNAQVSAFLTKSFSPGITKNNFAAYGDFFYIDDFWTFLVAQNVNHDDFNAEMGFLPERAFARHKSILGFHHVQKY